jgi:hypothetical protein
MYQPARAQSVSIPSHCLTLVHRERLAAAPLASFRKMNYCLKQFDTKNLWRSPRGWIRRYCHVGSVRRPDDSLLDDGNSADRRLSPGNRFAENCPTPDRMPGASRVKRRHKTGEQTRHAGPARNSPSLFWLTKGHFTENARGIPVPPNRNPSMNRSSTLTAHDGAERLVGVGRVCSP